MKRVLQVFSGILITCFLSAQTTADYKKEMIESGEKPRQDQNLNSSSDYPSFLQARAWRTTARSSSIFKDAADLDIPSIGGRVRSVLVDRLNDISLVAPSGGGLWTFNPEDGTGFSPINDLGSFLPITDIAQDPNKPNHIVIGTGDTHHFTSGNGLFESIDGGQTFTSISSTVPDETNDFKYITFVKFLPGSSSVIYISTGEELYKTTNSGDTWTEVYYGGRGKTIRSIDFYENGKVVLGVTNDGIYTSPTGELDSFEKQSTGLPSSVTTVLVSTHAANRNIAYAFFVDNRDQQGIYKTTNGGDSWTSQGDVSFAAGQAWFSVALGVHPTNPDILFAGSIGAGYSLDAGVTWNSETDFEVDFHTVHFHESDPDVVYVGYDQGFGRLDFGNFRETTEWQMVDGNWKQVTFEKFDQIELGKKDGFNTTQIYYGDYFPEAYGDAYLEGQQDGGAFGSTSNRKTRIRVGDGGSVFVNKQSPDLAMACTQRGAVNKATNATTPSYQDYQANPINAIRGDHPHFITQFAGNNSDGNQVYMLSNSQLKRTTDFGVTFSDIATVSGDDLKAGIVAVESAINPVVYVVGNRDVVVVNSAATSPVSSIKEDVLSQDSPLREGNPDRVNVDPNSAYTIYVTTTGGYAYKISDLDTETPTKTNIKGDIQDVIFNSVIAINGESEVLVAGTNIGLFYSLNSGENWVLSNEIPHTQVKDLKFRDSDNRLFVFTYGRGALAVTVDVNVVGLESKEIAGIDVFPNPATDYISISTDKQQFVKTAIYDVLGNKVAEGVDKINTSQLTTGTYILHVLGEKNEIIATEKISIIK